MVTDPERRGISFIADNGESFSKQSLTAADRFKKIDPFLQCDSDFFPALVLLAECHLLMNDVAGASRLASRAQHVLAQRKESDPILDHAVEMLSLLVESIMNDDEDPKPNEVNYVRPPDWSPSTTPSNLVELQSKWEKLQGMGNGAEQFARYAVVSTNELEGVFLLQGDSSLMVARLGMFATSIEGISQESRQQNPDKIVAILANTERGYGMMKNVVSGDRLFDATFVMDLHSCLLQDDNIMTFKSDGKLVAQLTPTGDYRLTSCFTDHQIEGTDGLCDIDYLFVNFASATDIPGEMDWFVNQVQAILSNKDLDPYRACAWIQHAFLRIHPFADGNGRVGRLISSIPLLRADLPPVFVAKESKEKYFKALLLADNTGDINGLVTFLQEETFKGIKKLLSFDYDGTA